jgi:hypothetical protein
MKLLHPFYHLESALIESGVRFFRGPGASANTREAWRRTVDHFVDEYLPGIYPPEVFSDNHLDLQALSPEHRAYATAILWALKFKHTGENTFRVGPYMADRLSSASLKGIDLEHVKLPFPFFFLQFESPVLVVDRGGAGDGRPVWAQGAYVMNHNDAPAKGVIGHGTVDQSGNFLRRTNTLQVEVCLLKEGDDLPFFVGAWPDIDPATGIIQDTNQDGAWRGPISAALGRERSVGEWYVRASEKLANIVRASINLALYMASINCETQQIDEGAAAKAKLRRKVKRLTGRAKRRAQERLDAHGGIRYIQVGPTKERQARDYKRRTGKTMGRGWRRAHWHSYWVGARKDIHGNAQPGEKKVLKWIDACEVNAHLEGGSPRVYNVKEAI